jgi:Family of unknown function (DUF5995)
VRTQQAGAGLMGGTQYKLGPVTTIPEVLTRLAVIREYIGANGPGNPVDGIGCFNELYALITQDVLNGMGTNIHKDDAFMGALDVAFANRYLDALRADATLPGSAAAPWNVLLERRGDQKLEKLQFAAAGVNAHIDYDLTPAVVTTWEILGTGARPPSTSAPPTSKSTRSLPARWRNCAGSSRPLGNNRRTRVGRRRS